MIKVLVGCEYSGIVRDAFTRHGCYAVSCDLKDSTSEGLHYTGDIRDLIASQPWDLGIFHPPCTYLCLAQVPKLMASPDRQDEARKAIEFMDMLWTSDIPHIALENPKGIVPRLWRNYDQLIYPWMFGDPYSKDICLWLKSLPPLISTCISPIRKGVSNHTNGRMTQAQKAHIRSKFFPRVADAMAVQWLGYLKSQGVN